MSAALSIPFPDSGHTFTAKDGGWNLCLTSDISACELYTSVLRLSLCVGLGTAGPSSESWQVPQWQWVAWIPCNLAPRSVLSSQLRWCWRMRFRCALLPSSTTGSAPQVLPAAWQGAVAHPDLASHQPRAAVRALKLHLFRGEHSLAHVPGTPGFVCDSFPWISRRCPQHVNSSASGWWESLGDWGEPLSSYSSRSA